jgi:hypothetical protein
MTTAVRASTRGAVGATAAAGVAVHPRARPSARTREGNHRWRERTPVGCTNQRKECNTLDPDGGPKGRPRTAAGSDGAAAG